MALMNIMTNGQGGYIDLTDGVEFNKLKGFAEDILQGKKSISDKEIVKACEKYADEEEPQVDDD